MIGWQNNFPARSIRKIILPPNYSALTRPDKRLFPNYSKSASKASLTSPGTDIIFMNSPMVSCGKLSAK